MHKSNTAKMNCLNSRESTLYSKKSIMYNDGRQSFLQDCERLRLSEEPRIHFTAYHLESTTEHHIDVATQEPHRVMIAIAKANIPTAYAVSCDLRDFSAALKLQSRHLQDLQS